MFFIFANYQSRRTSGSINGEDHPVGIEPVYRATGKTPRCSHVTHVLIARVRAPFRDEVCLVPN
jgi:hypothetical protein